MASHEYAPVTVQGRALHCLVCAHDLFWEHHLQLSSAMFAFLDPDSHAHCAVCQRCGHVHMFIPRATVPVDQPEAGAAPAGPAPQAA